MKTHKHIVVTEVLESPAPSHPLETQPVTQHFQKVVILEVISNWQKNLLTPIVLPEKQIGNWNWDNNMIRITQKATTEQILGFESTNEFIRATQSEI